jgi:uncharacterized membrane protein YgcG
MWASFGSLSVVPWILFAQSSWNMDAVPVITAAQSSTEVKVEVRDRAGVFGRGAERRAREVLQRVHRDHRFPVLVETVASLEGAWIADVAQQRGRLARADQFYVLVAGREQEVGVIAAKHGPGSLLTDQQRESVRRAFLRPLQAGEADGALEQGVRALAATLDSAATSRPKLSGREALISLTILVAALAVLLVSRTRAWYGVRNRRRRRTAAGAAEPGQVVGSPSASIMTPQIPRAAPASEVSEPLRTSRVSARCRKHVEA